MTSSVLPEHKNLVNGACKVRSVHAVPCDWGVTPTLLSELGLSGRCLINKSQTAVESVWPQVEAATSARYAHTHRRFPTTEGALGTGTALSSVWLRQLWFPFGPFCPTCFFFFFFNGPGSGTVLGPVYSGEWSVQEMVQMVLLLWFFMASLLFSSLVILLWIPSKYKPRSNCPAPRGILEKRKNKSRGDVTELRHPFHINTHAHTMVLSE